MSLGSVGLLQQSSLGRLAVIAIGADREGDGLERQSDASALPDGSGSAAQARASGLTTAIQGISRVAVRCATLAGIAVSERSGRQVDGRATAPQIRARPASSTWAADTADAARTAKATRRASWDLPD